MANKCYLCKKPVTSNKKLKLCKSCEKRVCRKLPLFIHCKPTDENLDGIIKIVADHIKKQDKRRYVPGKPIESFDKLVKRLENNEWVIVRYGMGNNKPTHPGWILSWQLKTVMQYVGNKRICEAIDKLAGTK